MTFMHASENKTFRLVVVFLMIFALALTVARPARAAVGVTSILIPAVIAALESWGIGTSADGLDGAEIAEWFHEKLTSWETAAGVVLENIAIGIKMTPLGQVLLNPVASMAIKDFAGWFIQQNGLTAGGPSVSVISPSGITFGGFTVYAPSQVVLSGTAYGTVNFYQVGDVPVYIFPETGAGGTRLTVVSSSSGASVRVTNGSDLNFVVRASSSRNRVYYATSASSVYTAPSVWNVDIAPYGRLDEILYYGNTTVVPGSEGSLDLVPSSDLDVPTTSDLQDKEVLIDAGLNVGADAAAWYDGVMQKVAANDFTATSTITNAGTITADQVLDQGAIREEDGAVVWPDVVQPIGVTGLDDIFPFCIPFDIYHFCEALAAEPVAPSFDVPFRIEGIVDYTFHLDLADFDDVAALLRTLELLLFIVGLAYATRSKFIRG